MSRRLPLLHNTFTMPIGRIESIVVDNGSMFMHPTHTIAILVHITSSLTEEMLQDWWIGVVNEDMQNKNINMTVDAEYDDDADTEHEFILTFICCKPVHQTRSAMERHVSFHVETAIRYVLDYEGEEENLFRNELTMNDMWNMFDIPSQISNVI